MASAPPVEPTLYHIKPTKLVPNSPTNPVLHYKRFFPIARLPSTGKVDPSPIHAAMAAHGWSVQWVARYGHQQRSHYHPETHECMAVLSGPGRVRFGAADLSDDWRAHTYGDAREPKGDGGGGGGGDGSDDTGVLVEAEVGDVFVIPAGVAHKNYDPRAEEMDAGFLTGEGHGIEEGAGVAMGELEVPETFAMMGSYPTGCDWTWAEGGDHVGRFEEVWKVPLPEMDPLFGGEGGIKRYWK